MKNTNTIELTKSIEEHKFIFIAEKNNNNITVRCKSEEITFMSMCGLVETSWKYDPVKLLNSVFTQHGQSFEGAVSFAYYKDYPEELEPGVTIDYLNDEIVVSEDFFRTFVIEYTQFFLYACNELNTECLADEKDVRVLIDKLS